MRIKFFDNILTKIKYSNSILFLKWLFSRKFLNWFVLGFLDFICGYGEKPYNVLRFSVIIIFLSAILFSIFGIATSPESIKLNVDLSEVISGKTSKIFLDFKLMNKILHNFGKCLYFSTVTFTTLGYGDFRPFEGRGRIIAGTEAFIGAFTMALLVYTFVTWGRRR